MKAKAIILNQMFSNEAIYVGISAITIAQVFIKVDKNAKDVHDSSLFICGPHSGVKLYDYGTSQLTTFFVPTIDLYQEGRIAYTKGTLNGSIRSAAEVPRQRECKHTRWHF